MEDGRAKYRTANRAVTLKDLKEQLYSLNMRLLLAMQNHDGEAQADIQKQIEKTREEMERMGAGGFR